MRIRKISTLLLFLAIFGSSCSVISRQVRSEAEPHMSFKAIAENVYAFSGKTVILAGYVLETKPSPDETTLEVLQAPLGLRDEPKEKTQSEGRFSVLYKGLLDPEIYRKDRKITVAGTIIRPSSAETESHPWPYIKVESREIYIWPEQKEARWGFYSSVGFGYRDYNNDRHHRMFYGAP